MVDSVGTKRLRRLVLRSAVATVAVVLLPLSVTGTAKAAGEDPSEAAACPVIASAQGTRTTVGKTGDVVLAKPSGADLTAAQACIHFALSASTAYASAAYPGETARTASGTTADFPAYVSSSYPTQRGADVEQGPITLHALSSRTHSEAKAVTGPPSTGTDAGRSVAEAKGSVDPEAGSAVASAVSVAIPMEIGGVLRLGEVRTRAEVRFRPDGTIDRSSAIEIARTTVAGQVVTITSDGVQAAGQALPIPSDEGVAEALDAAGVHVSYLSAEKTASGILSPGLQIRVQNEDSSGARTTVEYAIGRSFAAVSPVQREATSEAGPTAPPAGASVGDPEPSAGTSSGLTGSVTPTDVAPQLRQPPSAGPVLTPPRRLSAAAIDLSFSRFYLLLLIGGVVLLGSSTSVRLWGVRTRWIS